MKALGAAYFTHRNYSILYAYGFISVIAMSVIHTFSGAWMLSLGLAPQWVFLAYAVEFGIMGLCAPLGLFFSLRHGAFLTSLVSNILMACGIICISLMDASLWLIVPGVLLKGLAAGLINPLHDVMEAIYFENHNRGRGFTMTMAIRAMGAVLGIFAGGLFIAQGSFLTVALICFALLALSSMPFLWIEERVRGSMTPPALVTVFRQPLSRDFRPYFLAAAGEQFSIIAKIVILPLLLYSVIRDFENMAYIIAAAIVAQTLILLLFGNWIDKGGRKPLFVACSANCFALAFYALVPRTPLLLCIADMMQRLGSGMFTSGYRGRVHAHISHKRSALIMFGAGWQMSLCLSEAIVLSMFSAIIAVMGTGGLPLLVMICVGGIYLGWWQVHRLDVGTQPVAEDVPVRL